MSNATALELVSLQDPDEVSLVLMVMLSATMKRVAAMYFPREEWSEVLARVAAEWLTFHAVPQTPEMEQAFNEAVCFAINGHLAATTQ